VLRVQPNEAVYMKMLTKTPGLTTELAQSELDLSYKSRFEGLELPDGAEHVIFFYWMIWAQFFSYSYIRSL